MGEILVAGKGIQSNRENREQQKDFWNVIVLQEKSHGYFVCADHCCDNTINIPEIFQVFTVLWSHYKSRGKGTRREALTGGRQD